MSEYNLGGIPDDDEFDRKSAGQYDLTGIPDDNDSDDVAASLQQKYNSANQNPDQIATAKRHAEKAGIPMLVAQNQPDKAAKLANAPDWTRLTKDAPVTARTLANDGTLFQVAHDDHDSLSGIEQGLVTLGKAVPVVGQAVQAVDTTKKLIEGMTGISLMGDKDDVGTVLKKYQENWMPQARKTALGLFLAGDSALANLTAANKGGGTGPSAWYYRQNKDAIDAEADRIVRLADSHDPIEQNRALQIAQEYGFDSVPRYMNGDKSANKAALIDAISNSEAQRNFENRDDQQDRLNRQGALVDMIHGYDQQLRGNAVEVDPYTVPWLISNSAQFVDQMAQAVILGGGLAKLARGAALRYGASNAGAAAIAETVGGIAQATGFAAPVAGQSYATDKAAGLSDSEAAGNAIANTLIETTTETFGAESIKNAAKGLVPILKGIGVAGGKNFLQEQAAEIAGQVYNGFANQEFVEQPDYIKGLDAPEPVKQFLAILDQQLQAGVIGAAGVGAMAVTGAGVKAGVDKYNERKQAKLDEQVQQAREQIDTARTRSSQIIETIEKIRTSKLKARDTSSLKALIQSIGDAENDAPTAMLLSADAFKQGGIDPELFKRAVPSAADQVDRAIELGGTIAIDIGELANITDSEVEQGLIPHLKVHEDEWTQYEAEAAELQSDEAMAEMQEAADMAAREAENQDEWTRQSDEIRTKYEEQLNKVGQYDKAANKKMAALVSAFYSTTASKLAKHDQTMTPTRLFNEAMMRVSGGIGSGQVFNQPGLTNDEIDFYVAQGIYTQEEADKIKVENSSNPQGKAVENEQSTGSGDHQDAGYIQGESDLLARLVRASDSIWIDRGRTPGLVGAEWTKAASYSDLSLRGGSFVRDERSPEVIKTESDRLIASAKKNGFFVDKGAAADLFSKLSEHKLNSGMEHDAFRMKGDNGGVVIRATAGGRYGPDETKSPAQYLHRIEEYNKTFPDLQMRVIGVGQRSDGKAYILTAQKYVNGKEFENMDQLHAAMVAHGWESIERDHEGKLTASRYINKKTGAIISDVHEGNVLHDSEGNLYPIDVHVEKLPHKGVFHQSQNTNHNPNKERIAKRDAEYIAAVERGDMETAQKLVDEAAAEAGYDPSTSERMNHAAPNSTDGMSVSLADVRSSDLVPEDFWTHPKRYASDNREMVAHRNVMDVMRRVERKRTGEDVDTTLTVYRAIPKNAKDTKMRNGDWVSPLKSYAEDEGLGIQGGYKIIAEKADAAHLYFNGDSIAELGFDNGKGYAYKNTKNNRKLADAVTRDEDGNIVPLSKRFNARKAEEFLQNKSAPRGAFDPNTLNITLLEGADLSTFLHESGHFFLEMYARYADQSAEIGQDMDALLNWFGVAGKDASERLERWRSMTVDQQRQHHEQFAESFEQYLFTGKAPSIALQPAFASYRRWLANVYKSLARFVAGHPGAKLNPEIAAVMDRMLATQDQIDEMTQARDSRPLFANADQAGMTQAQWDAYMQDQVRSVEQAADTLVARSLRDMKWLTNAKNKQLRKLQREAQALRAQVQMEARRTVLSSQEYRAWLFLKRATEKKAKKPANSKTVDPSQDSLLTAIAKFGGLDMEEVVSSWGVDPADFAKKGGVFGKPVLRKKGGLSIETIAEKLLEEGYLTPDQHGKVDLAEFEEKLDRAARGEPMYSVFADYDLLLYGDEKRAAMPRREDVDYIGGRLNRNDLVDMYGTNNPEVKWHRPIDMEGRLFQGGGNTENKTSIDAMAAEGVALNGEVNDYGNGKAVLESRLEQWRAANGLHGRRGASTVHGELGQAAEAEGDNGSGARTFALGGESKETIRRQSEELIARAKEKGFFLDVEDYVALAENLEPMKGGTEHDVYRTEEGENSVVIRNTKDGVYGFIDGASPQQYLARLYRNNQVFPATPIHLLGVSEGKDGEAVIWTAQPFVKGKTYDNERKFNMAMSDHGWEPHNRPNSYIHKESGIVIRDASKANVLYVGDELFPIDVIVERIPEAFYQDKDEDQKEPGAVRNLESMRMVSDDGLHPDVVAELFGLSSGDELVRKLLEIDDPFTAVDKLTDKIMMERYSEFTDQKELERMAEAAIHNEARVRFVATELAMLNKAQGGQKDLKRIIDAARLYAQDLLAGQRISDIRPSTHAADAARAGKAAERSFAKGNIAETIVAKRNQVLHTELVRQAHAAKDEVDKGLKYFARIEKAVNNGVLDADYAQQIIGLLQQHDLRKSVSLIDLERRESLAAWVQAQQDAGFEPMIPENLLMEAAKTHYKRMTLDEFRELVDAIKNIDHLGRLKYKLVQNARKRELAAAAAEIGESIADNATGEVQTRLEKNSVKDRIFDLANGFLYMHRKFASLIRQMDGWKDGGVLWDYFVKTMNDAGDREAVMREQATMAMADLMKPLHESGGFGMMPKKLFITQIGTSLTREGRLMVALNWGNEGNRQRLMDGEGWDVNQVNAVLATLNAEDWKFVQGVWDHLETYRPMVGEQQKRLSGIEPKWIEASPFMVAGRDGQTYELRGGYLPVKYDADRSTKSLTQDALSNIMDQHKAVRAKTRDSFTKGRAAKVVNRPLRKDFGVIFQHMTEVTHRLAWQDWLMDSKRLLAQPAVDEAVRKHYGPAMVEELQKTLDDIATGEVGPANEFEAAINHLRTGTTVAGLGLNFMTSLMQPLGLTQSMVRIGPTWVMKGLAKWGRMDDALPWIYERSDFMRLRGKTFQREINEELNKIRSPKRSAFNDMMFILIQKGQIIADVPTWLGAYEKAIAEQGPNIDEKLAAKLADQAVLDAQSGGMQKDLARIQRGGSLQRLFTMFYSYFSSTYNLSVESVRKVNMKDPATVMSAAIDFLLLYSLPAAIGTAMKFALTGDDDEDEFWHRMALDQVSYFLAVMVGLREFGAVVSGFSGYSGPAGTRFFNEAAKLATQIGQGDMDAAMLKALNNVGGILLHYPAGQISRTVQGASALLNDETNNPAALLFGSRK